jgi:hypothetical protein
MASPLCERAIEDAVRFGHALLKFISANDVGLTGSHQYGYYLPKADDAWPVFSPQKPEKGVKFDHPIRILWQTGRVTRSTVKWYGQKTRAEYRLTGFGKDFPFIAHDVVGELLILIRESEDEFRGYVLDTDDDIEETMARLGVNPFRNWAVYHRDQVRQESESECIERNFREFGKDLVDFPTGDEFSEETWCILADCIRGFPDWSADRAIVQCMDTEFNLFRHVERRLCQSDLVRLFKDVDDFIATAQTILQRRKSRAGRSFENHVGHYLKAAGIPYAVRPEIEGRPDIVIPGDLAYRDDSYPVEKLFVVGVKTTARDRWPQILKEGPRVPRKHLITFQRGMAVSQLKEMRDAGIVLVVPEPFHKMYPPEKISGVPILSVEGFVNSVQERLS